MCVEQQDLPNYKRGDVVRVMDDLAEVTKLQKGHGGWIDEMSYVSLSQYVVQNMYACTT